MEVNSYRDLLLVISFVRCAFFPIMLHTLYANLSTRLLPTTPDECLLIFHVNFMHSTVHVSLWPARHGETSTAAQPFFDGAQILPADNFFIVIGFFSSFVPFLFLFFTLSLSCSLSLSFHSSFLYFSLPPRFLSCSSQCVSGNRLGFNGYGNGIKLIQTTAIAEIPCNCIAK